MGRDEANIRRVAGKDFQSSSLRIGDFHVMNVRFVKISQHYCSSSTARISLRVFDQLDDIVRCELGFVGHLAPPSRILNDEVIIVYLFVFVNLLRRGPRGTIRFMDIRRFFKSFQRAFAGIAEELRKEQSFQIQLVAGILVVATIFLFSIPAIEAALLVFVVTVILGFELFNTAIERLANVVSPDHHQSIKAIKDLSAAAVLVVAIGAVVVGLFLILIV